MENQLNINNQNGQLIGQNSVNQPIQIPDKPKINHWKISTIILSLVLLVGGLYYLTLTNNIYSIQSEKLDKTENISPTKYLPTTAPSPDKKEGNNYKQRFTHINAVDKYGFEFQHENSFGISTGENIDSLSSPERIFTVYFYDPEPYFELSIGITKKSESQIITELGKYGRKLEPITINDTTGQKFYGWGGEAGSVYEQTIILRKDNFTYIISSGSYTENDKRFTELLNTFKFTKF